MLIQRENENWSAPEACTSPIRRIVSAGQPGAERTALDWAIEHGLEHGGFCPRRRQAEGGPIPGEYLLTETRSGSALVSEEGNVRDSDGTLIFTCKSGLNAGSKRVQDFARKQGKPALHIWRAAPFEWTVQAVRKFVQNYRITVVNVTGARLAKEPFVSGFLRDVLDAVFLDADTEPQEPRLVATGRPPVHRATYWSSKIALRPVETVLRPLPTIDLP